jgi:DNA polymerase-3 subunit gamma/tau
MDSPSPRAEAPRPEIARGTTRAALAAAPAEMTASAPAVHNVETTAAVRVLGSFEALVALAAEKRDLGLKTALEREVRLVRLEDGRLEIALEASAPKTLTGELSKKLGEWTGRRWMVIVSAEAGQPSLYAQAQMRQAELKDGVRGDPLVQAVLARFPGAEIVDVRPSAETGTAHELPFDSSSDATRTDEEDL